MNSPEPIPLGKYRGFDTELLFNTTERTYEVSIISFIYSDRSNLCINNITRNHIVQQRNFSIGLVFSRSITLCKNLLVISCSLKSKFRTVYCKNTITLMTLDLFLFRTISRVMRNSSLNASGRIFLRALKNACFVTESVLASRTFAKKSSSSICIVLVRNSSLNNKLCKCQ